MFSDDEIERFFGRTHGLNLARLFEEAHAGNCACYGYTVSIEPDGRPVVREYGNGRPDATPGEQTREPLVDTIVDEKDGQVKLVAEMPGVEKGDVKVVVEGKAVNIDAERGEKKYHVRVPIRHRVDKDSAKASYKNGILELVFKLAEPEKPKGKTVEVQ